MVHGSWFKVKGSQFQVSKYKFPNPTVSGLQSIVLNLQSKHNISGVKISAVPFSECAGGGAVCKRGKILLHRNSCEIMCDILTIRCINC